MHELMKAGKVIPVIDKRYRLSEVPEALRYVEEGHARGKVVITVDQVNLHFIDYSTIYSYYQLNVSAWTPLQITREHNGRRTAQFFYDSCRYDPGFPQDLFSKDSLKTRGAELVPKKK